MTIRKIIQCFAFVLPIFILSCEKESTNSLLFVPEYGIDSETGIQVTWDGDETTFRIASNTDWSIEILTEPKGGGAFVLNSPKSGVFNHCEWLQVYPLCGSGDATINIKIAENNEIYSRDAILVIHTNDGRRTENVWILQDGKELSGYKTFEVFPLDSRLFHGRAHDLEDSLYVISPHGAEISGPSWLEAKVNSEDWKPLSEDKPRYLSGLSCIALRTAGANLDENDLEGSILVNDTWHENYVDIKVTQLGRYNVKCNHLVCTADGFASDWRYGFDVTSFYVKAFIGSPSSSDLRWVKIRKWQKFDAKDDLVIGWGGLKEQTRYEVIPIGVDDNDNHSSNVTSRGINTGTSNNQPRAIISNVTYDSSLWKWSTMMNEYADFYYIVVWNGTGVDELPDAWVKWNFMNNVKKLKKQTGSHSWSSNYNGHIHFATIACDSTNTPSFVLDRYRTSSDFTRGIVMEESCVGMSVGDFNMKRINISMEK